MTRKFAYIVSLKFAPGLKKEFEVLGENIRGKGIPVKYLLSERYSQLECPNKDAEYVTRQYGVWGMIYETLKHRCVNVILNKIKAYPPLFVCFYNAHPLNPYLAKIIKKKFPSAALSLYLHDPYKSDKKSYGLAKGIYIRIVELIQNITIKHMDYVISPSDYSSDLFTMRYPKFKGKNHIAPLLIPDKRHQGSKSRKLFSIVGTAHSATGHDTFVEMVNYVAEKEKSYEFALISSSTLTPYLKKLNGKAQKILKVINKNLITDSEINEIIRESYTVFRLDREVTQSGVTPVCYMNATPVIARDILGLRQHVKDRVTGYLVPPDCTPQDLIHAMEFVKGNFAELSENARKYYEEIWAEWNFNRYYKWLYEDKIVRRFEVMRMVPPVE